VKNDEEQVAMRERGTGAKPLLIGTIIALSWQISVHPAQASPTQQLQSASSVRPASHAAGRHSVHAVAHGKFAAGARQHARGGISCVPFARNNSGIEVAGNAWQWWDNAAGVYARGSVPEPGSVLSFRANGRMRLGHVAVVTNVINAREIEIEHANWSGPGSHGGVATNIPVVDVSEANDWTAVRVGLGQTGSFGSVYPTYGFIYDKPDTGVMVASAGAPAPQPELNPAPSDLRPATERGWQTYEEVAEAPVAPKRFRRVVRLASNRTHQIAALSPRKQP
jgi:surface antigen